ncbi:DUF928 domain-containing protein [Kovacikia minuta CCNUW1]|uniref:DUF928 domain-containing protein n=1 Tax=Kovacikia minuta TaxID=2931930 RepID=UPI001CCA466C|nr:DUF928 domain-containing protein [Kovacikia minuta]UBF25614.1 DUF928 domain-containing protein [Kovacikia minuta CCNUW1]
MRLSKTCFKHQFLLGCVLALYLASIPAALARYRPPQGPPPRGTSVGGRRGACEGNEKIGLTALAPVSHVGHTSSTRPTFTWFMPVPDRQKTDPQSYLLQFRLYKASETDGEPLYETTMQSTSGIMPFSLPQNAPELSVGQRYVWRVILLCDPSYPSRVSIAQSEIEVVPLSADLKTQLSQSSDPITRANLYAAAGFWYDAFGEASKAPQDNRSRELQKALLEDLQQSESTGDSVYLTQHRDRLQSIITTNFQPK